ncbi:MAG: hypothetical protein EA357_03605 [Micavibrio sp.]|nr:MAG: hypothetical protein EA357_03605 [Micavibrio sp.]
MSADKKIDFVLQFPEGNFLIAGGTPYFHPEGSDKAYLGWGEKKELLGKFHHKIETRAEEFKKYDLTYEVEDGELIAARLITPFNRSAGKLADEATVAKLNDDLENGRLELKGRARPPHITRAAKFGDGRLLLLVDGLKTESRHTLLVGTPGNYEEIGLKNGIQGGSSFYYKTENDTDLALPYGNGETPQYGNEYLAYIPVDNAQDLAAFGVDFTAPDPHLDPFCKEMENRKPASAPGKGFTR